MFLISKEMKRKPLSLDLRSLVGYKSVSSASDGHIGPESVGQKILSPYGEQISEWDPGGTGRSRRCDLKCGHIE